MGVKPAEEKAAWNVYAEVTLLFSDKWFADVGQEPGIGGSATRVGIARLSEAQMAIDGQTDLGGILVLLSIVFPPANRAQLHRGGRFQGPAPTTRAAKENCRRLLSRGGLHIKIDDVWNFTLTTA